MKIWHSMFNSQIPIGARRQNRLTFFLLLRNLKGGDCSDSLEGTFYWEQAINWFLCQPLMLLFREEKLTLVE